MMEKVSYFWNNIKDRISNPLVFSFMLAWMFFNWEIVIALVWYDPNQIKNEGSVSIFQFIQSRLYCENYLWKPLIAAFLYTFSSPIFKNVVVAFNSWTTKWGTNWSLKISGDGKVGIEKYLKLRAEYDRRTQILEEAITKESATVNEVNSLSTELLKAKDEINGLKIKESELNDRISRQISMQIIHGYWTVKFSNSSQNLTGEDEVFINEGGNYYLLRPFGEREHTYNLTNLYHDVKGKSIFFVKENVNLGEMSNPATKQLKYNVTKLTYEREDKLIGHENGTTRIEYRRSQLKNNL